MKAENLEDLVKQAQRAQKRAYAPYSLYPVGAALLGSSGKIYWGVNVENASYGLTICAERSAIYSAIASGERSFEVMAIAADGEVLPSPCGACRQVMEEFKVPWIITADMKKNRRMIAGEQLLPFAFKKDNLEKQGVNND